MLQPGDLNRARELFEANEPRDLFYRVALDLLDRTRAGQSGFTVTEAVAVVLQTWNRRFYVSTGIKFDARHFADIDELLQRYGTALDAYLARSIESLDPSEQAGLENMFNDFELVVGPVGAAKALHVLAPRFFALWDRSIAEGAGIYIDMRGTNANRYWRWTLRAQADFRSLGGEAVWGPGLLKRLDELNYCRFTIKVM
jgi:hypothetical protein